MSHAESEGDWSSALTIIEFSTECVVYKGEKTRARFHLKLMAKDALPTSLKPGHRLCLAWPMGGIWKVKIRELNVMSLEATKDVAPNDFATPSAKNFISPSLDTLPLFDWTVRKLPAVDTNAWYVSQLQLPASPHVRRGLTLSKIPRLSAWRFTMLPRTQVSLDIAAIHDVDTARQRYTADVTWKVTLPGVTCVREDRIMHEFLSLIELDENAFSFTNALDVRREEEIAMEFPRRTRRDSRLDAAGLEIFDLQLSRRVVAEFTAQMNLKAFPFDQQTLSFSFALGRGLAEDTTVEPRPENPGSFTHEAFSLANVWRTPTQDTVFIGAVVNEDRVKTIRFAILLERQSTHYIVNIALPAMMLTYLCFSSYAPMKDKENHGEWLGSTLMDTDARLQIVITLLLTAVTFKNQVSTFIPQVSYFTILDMYILLCFLTAGSVATETALFPLFARFWGLPESWREFYVVFPFLGFFTVLNVGIATYLYRWKKKRCEHLSLVMKLLKHKQQVSLMCRADELTKELETFVHRHRQELFRSRTGNTPDLDMLLREYTGTKYIDGVFIKLLQVPLWPSSHTNATHQHNQIGSQRVDPGSDQGHGRDLNLYALSVSPRSTMVVERKGEREGKASTSPQLVRRQSSLVQSSCAA